MGTRAAAQLTPRAVARLAATGQANQQIASTLVVSVKTVEYHLGNVSTRLGLTLVPNWPISSATPEGPVARPSTRSNLGTIPGANGTTRLYGRSRHLGGRIMETTIDPASHKAVAHVPRRPEERATADGAGDAEIAHVPSPLPSRTADPYLGHLVRHLGVWLGFQVLVFTGWFLNEPVTGAVGVAAAIAWALRVLVSTGYRRRDVILLAVPIVSLVVGHRCVWRYTARHAYWDADASGRLPAKRSLAVAVAFGWVGLPLAAAAVADSSGPAPVEAVPADQRAADDMVLRTEDFPLGWRAVAQEDVLDVDEQKEVGEIRALNEATHTAVAVSPLFIRHMAAVSSEVRIATTAALAANHLDILRDPEAGGTWDEAAAELAGDLPGDVSPLETKTFDVPGVGDEALRVRAVFESVVGDERTLLYSDTYFVRQGRVLASVEVFDVDEPFDADLARSLVAKVADRMARVD